MVYIISTNGITNQTLTEGFEPTTLKCSNQLNYVSMRYYCENGLEVAHNSICFQCTRLTISN